MNQNDQTTPANSETSTRPSQARATAPPLVSIVIIGRNEGERLSQCLESVYRQEFDGDFECLYVDSGSSDDSLNRAEQMGARVFSLNTARPTAAKGRNLGWQMARAALVFFLDGDTIVHPNFLQIAVDYLQLHADVAVVWGHRRETRPHASFYNRVLDLDWMYPPGETAFCGGDAVMRRGVLEELNGFSERLVAGEEPELCHRIRAQGYRIMHLDEPMTGHDLAIHSLSGYLKRCFRAGHAYAQVASITRGETFGRESRRNHLQTLIYMLVPLVVAGLFGSLALIILPLGAAFLILRSAWRTRWRRAAWSTTLAYAFHSHAAQPIIWMGQLKFYWDRLRGRDARLIEYK